jgi:inner membrane protein
MPLNGDEHITISLATAAAVLAPWLWSIHPAWLIAGIFGVFIGALAPDADANDSAIFHTRVPGGRGKKLVILPVFGYGIRYLIYYPISLPFIALCGERGMPRHRGVLHSLIGAVLMTALLGFYAWAIGAVVFGIPWDMGFTVFLLGFLGGAVCHLLEDSCTRSGVAWLFPLSDHRTRGKIVTGSGDLRPTVYAASMCAVAFGLAAVGPAGLVPADLYPWAGTAAACILWILFLITARIGR